jgi:hypothetical protein
MSNMQFNGDGNTIVVPAVNTDKGYVLWALLRYGSQTVEELQALTDIRGISPRVYDLNNPIPIVYTTTEQKTRQRGALVKTVDIVRYHINFNLVDLRQLIWQDFLQNGDAHYMS